MLNNAWSNIADFTAWITGKIWKMLNNAWSNINSFTDWIKKNLWKWLNNAWSNLVKFTEWITGKISKAINTSVASMKTWVEQFASDFLGAITGSFFTGLNKGIEEDHKFPLNVDKDSENDIVNGLQHYMKKYREEKNKKVR